MITSRPNGLSPWNCPMQMLKPPMATPVCRFTTTLLARYVDGLGTRDSRFDQMRDGVWALVKAEDEGHHLGASLDVLKLAYVAATIKDRKDSGGEPPASEYDRALKMAREKVAADPTDPMFKACCAAADDDVTPPELADVVPDDEAFDGDEIELSPYDQAVRRKYAELRLLDDAALPSQQKARGRSEPTRMGVSARSWMDSYESEKDHE